MLVSVLFVAVVVPVFRVWMGRELEVLTSQLSLAAAEGAAPRCSSSSSSVNLSSQAFGIFFQPRRKGLRERRMVGGGRDSDRSCAIDSLTLHASDENVHSIRSYYQLF